jgi:hypothetical protein
MCQELGFSAASNAKGYFHKECGGPHVLSCDGLECAIDPTCDCGGCGDVWNRWDGVTISGGGTTSYSVTGHGYDDPTQFNPGVYVRLACR